MSKKRRRDNKTYQQKPFIKKLEAKTDNQADYIRSIIENKITICYGPAGTGKSYIAVGIACHQLYNRQIKNVVVAKPILGCNNEIGFLPGNLADKIHPYLLPSLEYFNLFLGQQTANYINTAIKMYPVSLIRGHTYNDSLMILEESQNCTPKQIKLFLSRIGTNSSVVVVGDNKQSDIDNNGLQFCINHFKSLRDINIIQLTSDDTIRNSIIPHILTVFEKNGI